MPRRSVQSSQSTSISASPFAALPDLPLLEQSITTMIAQQRSQSLYDFVSQGEISLDDMLAFPIDWQGIAIERQYQKASTSKVKLEEEDLVLPTRSPMQVKRAPRKRQRKQQINKGDLSITFDEEPCLSPNAHSTAFESSSSPSLGLDLGLFHGSLLTSQYSPQVNMSDIDDNSSCPPSPALTFSSGEESGTSTPISCSTHDSSFDEYGVAQSIQEQKPTISQLNTTPFSFPLKSFCTVFNDTEEEEVFAF